MTGQGPITDSHPIQGVTPAYLRPTISVACLGWMALLRFAQAVTEEAVLSLSISPACPHAERLSKAGLSRPQMSYGSHLYKVCPERFETSTAPPSTTYNRGEPRITALGLTALVVRFIVPAFDCGGSSVGLLPQQSIVGATPY